MRSRPGLSAIVAKTCDPYRNTLFPQSRSCNNLLLACLADFIRNIGQSEPLPGLGKDPDLWSIMCCLEMLSMPSERAEKPQFDYRMVGNSLAKERTCKIEEFHGWPFSLLINTTSVKKNTASTSSIRERLLLLARKVRKAGKGTGDKSKATEAKRLHRDDGDDRPGRKKSKANDGTAHRAGRAPTRKKAAGANEDVAPKPRKRKRAAGGDEENEDVAPKSKKMHKNTAPDSDADAALPPKPERPKPRRVVKVPTPTSAGAPPADTADTAGTSAAIHVPGPASGAPTSSASPSSTSPSDASASGAPKSRLCSNMVRGKKGGGPPGIRV
ncbi:hypothetical protein C8R44DRAFT_742625 [Mycena epipterygia]|nr:hypothetical protein C8R44DRAFT_742625 [Mycena epipterygia]